MAETAIDLLAALEKLEVTGKNLKAALWDKLMFLFELPDPLWFRDESELPAPKSKLITFLKHEYVSSGDETVRGRAHGC